MAELNTHTALILVDHGSRFPEANEMLLEVVAMVKRLSGLTRVYPAHMELAEPSIRQAFETAVRDGADSRRRPSVLPFPRSPFHHGHPPSGRGGGARRSRA